MCLELLFQLIRKSQILFQSVPTGTKLRAQLEEAVACEEAPQDTVVITGTVATPLTWQSLDQHQLL